VQTLVARFSKTSWWHLGSLNICEESLLLWFCSFGSLVSGNSHGLLLGEAATQVLQWELELMILQVVSLLLNCCCASLSCYQTCTTWCIYLWPFANVLISCIWCIWQEPSLSCSLAEDLQDVKLEDTGSPSQRKIVVIIASYTVKL
jgi:hypothetical protein